MEKCAVTQQKCARKIMLKKGVKDQLVAYAFLMPAIIFYLLFKYIPIAEGVFISFFKVNLVDLPGEFIGFDNYIRVFMEPDFYTALWHNLKFFIYWLLLNFWPPIVLAFMINEITGRGKSAIRLLYYVPAVMPGIAMSILVKYFWQPDYGIANYIMQLLGLPPQMWLNDEKLVYLCMHLPGMLFGAGAGFLIYLAAIKDIPLDMFEAAIIDGAGFTRRIFSIAIPQMKHIIALVVMMQIISVINMIDNVLVQTGGGPAGATNTAVLYAYRQAIDYMDYGYAIAMANVVMVIVFILTVLQRKLTDKEGEV